MVTEQTERTGDKQGSRLRRIAQEIQVFRTPSGDTYARIPKNDQLEIHPLRSKVVRAWLTNMYDALYDTAPSTTTVENTIAVLEARAYMQDETEEVYVRLAAHEGALYLDLCNAAWEVVKITPNGWEVVSDCPVNFRRTKGALPLPTPVKGGSFADLRRLINVGPEENWVLMAAWTLSTLHPTGPYPVLTFVAEQGSAKSTTARFLRGTIDPNAVPLLGVPRDSQTLMLQANNNWIVALDNLSTIPPWLSDDLCRLATGGGNSKKQLYTDSEEVLYNAKRPVIITGIGDLATKGDLLERMVIVNLPQIPKAQRRSEEEINALYGVARPRILGGLLDVACAALKNHQDVHLEELPRMADFAIWTQAAEEALGWKSGTFISTYVKNRDGATSLEIEASPVARAVRTFMERKTEWKGTATELLAKLDEIADETTRRQHVWPKAPHILSNRLTAHAPALRSVGLDVTISHSGDRSITIRQVETRTNNGPVRDPDGLDASDASPHTFYSSSYLEEREEDVGKSRKGASTASTAPNHEPPDPPLCAYCGNRVTADRLVHTPDDDWWCETCISNEPNAWRCEVCEAKLREQASLCELPDQRPPCATCGQVLPPNRQPFHCDDGHWRCCDCFQKLWLREGAVNICPNCAKTYNTFVRTRRHACAECGRVYEEEDMSAVGDAFYCLACEEAILNGSDPRESMAPEEACCEHPDEHRASWKVSTRPDGSSHVMCDACLPF